MSRLTEELGLTKGALYYYVKDKSDDLLYRLHLKSAEAAERAHARGAAVGTNGYECVTSVIRHYVEALAKSPTETFILLEESALAASQIDEIVKRRKALEADLRRQIQMGLEDGSISPCDVKLTVFIIVGAMAWLSKWYDGKGACHHRTLQKGYRTCWAAC
jgi:TetR/AcrR family transcriptional regulator